MTIPWSLRRSRVTCRAAAHPDYAVPLQAYRTSASTEAAGEAKQKPICASDILAGMKPISDHIGWTALGY